MGVIPAADNQLQKRYYCSGYGYYYDGYDGCYYSGWNAYGRWILLAVIIVGAFLLFLLFSCITARRRRRQGQNPYPLTGWAGGRPGYSQQPVYNQPGGYNQGYNQGSYNAPPPAYGQQYGGQPQQPGAIYQGPRGGENVYNNNGQKDNVVR